jgi:hypothetical protein
MAIQPRLNRRLVLPFVLAVILAGEVTGLALAVRARPAASPSAVGTDATSWVPGDQLIRDNEHARPVAGTTPSAAPTTIAATVKTRPPVSAAAIARTAIAAAKATTPADTSSTAFRGRNHVWIPSLGISRSVSAFACTRSRPPDNYMYRWGCAGRNNVYLLGHANSVMKPLHDAYVRGRLHKGMKAFYADASGHVRAYAVIWWRVTPPATSGSWAWAAQSRPSMTLQTCVGANSAYRLVVRLVAVK